MDPITVLNLMKIPDSISQDDQQVRLFHLCEVMAGKKVSGRFLRKIPFTTFSNHFPIAGPVMEPISLSDFIAALEKEINK